MTINALYRPFIPARGVAQLPAEPVDIRLVASREAVANALSVLDEVFILSDVSDPHPARDGHVRVYATITRRTPLKGGTL